MGMIRSPWAIKKLNKSHAKGDIANRLDKEAKILKSLNHPNIIGKLLLFKFMVKLVQTTFLELFWSSLKMYTS
jgi:serine/threonine protein kinase